jgi:DNA-binding beta-propeller fold protein YncE
VSIGGEALDLALDEARGVVYVANFGANRIEVISTADLSLRSSMNVAAHPSALALSRNNRYLLVAHYGNFQPPNTSGNLLTLIELDSGARQTFPLGAPPLGVAFAYNNVALVVTATDFLLFDPVSGSIRQLATVEGVTANTLPAPPEDFPPQIVAASMAASGDGVFI